MRTPLSQLQEHVTQSHAIEGISRKTGPLVLSHLHAARMVADFQILLRS